MMAHIMTILAGILVVAAAATLGDFIWYTVGVRHTMTAGLVHGALLLTTVGAALGAASGRLVKGLPLGTLAGIGGALCYYALIVVMDSRTYGTAIPGAWVFMWLLLAALEGRWLRAPQRRSWAEVLGRGAAAAIAGGLAFVLVRSILWGRPAGAERNYFLQFAAWAFAWAPGLLALTWGTSPVRAVPENAGGARESSGPGAAAGAISSVAGGFGAAHGPADAASAARQTQAGGVDAETASVSANEVLARIDRGDALYILDVRSEGEFALGHVPGAANIPFNQMLSRVSEVPGTAEEELIVYCGHGPRAYMAAAALRSGGRTRIVYMSGHFSGWQSAGLRIER